MDSNFAPDARLVEKNPRFSLLLARLSEQVSYDGTTKESQQKLEEAKATLNREKLKYFQNAVLLREVKDYIYEAKAQPLLGQEVMGGRLCDILQRVLSSAHASAHLPVGDGEDTPSLFSIDEETLRESELGGRDDLPKQVQELQQYLIPLVEERLYDRCKMVEGYFHTISTEHGPVEKAVEEVRRRGPKAVAEVRRRVEAESWELYKVLAKKLELVMDILVRLKLQCHAPYHRDRVDYLVAECTTSLAKIQELKYDLLQKTYTPNTVPALEVIRNTVVAERAAREKDFEDANGRLQEYQRAPPEFNQLVADYARVSKEIENRKWVLQNLMSNSELANRSRHSS